jgi:hypothetical protein
VIGGLSVYQLFKDFAGPVATIIAAIAAVSVTAYFAWHQKSIAEQQAMFAREKLKHDLFDRRYGIYFAFERMIRCMMGQDGLGTDEENLLTANVSAAQAVFILDDEISDYLFSLHKIAFRKTTYDDVMKIPDLPLDDKQKHTTQWMEDTKTIQHAIPVLSEKFRPFLQLKDFRGR